MINFGSGKLIAVPTNLADGTAIANPTPVILGTMQDVSLDLSVEMKTLYGSKRYKDGQPYSTATPTIGCYLGG